MTLLRAVWADLLEKRLWPVAALLVAALVAAPLVLPKLGGPAASTAPLPALPGPASAPAGDGATQLTIAAPSVVSPLPRGRYRDPFNGGAAAGAAAGASAAAGAHAAPSSPASTAGASARSDAAAPASATSPSAAKPATAPKPAPSPVVAPTPAARAVSSGVPAGYRADVTWGRLGEPLKLHDLVRLARLPAGARTGAIYMGVRKGGRVAVFLLAPGVTAAGEGRCYPNAAICQLVELRRGDAERLAVAGDGGGVSHYRLRLAAVAQRRAATRDAARRLRKRESRAGRAALYGVIRSGRTYVAEFMYVSARGMLFKHAAGRAPNPEITASAPVVPALGQ